MKHTTPKYLFLLGGSDLEMEEIKKLLIRHNQDYKDEGLTWESAFINAYTEYFEEFQYYDKVFGIELRQTGERSQEIPDNYQSIDHHGLQENSPSSLEQVAQLLNFTLNYEQQLIAANDKGYIPAMIALGATREQCDIIRERDRKAQGVTLRDEERAQKAIQNSSKYIRGTRVIESETSAFSTITDRLYPIEKLIIYHEKELNYYGDNKYRLVRKFTKEIEEGKAYHGGGERGYFGITHVENMNDIIQEIVTCVSFISFHAFLFPFSWCDNETRDLTKAFKDLHKQLATNDQHYLRYSPFKLSITQNESNYNEFVYFYDFAQEVIYDLKKGDVDATGVLRHYSIPKELLADSYYKIKISKTDTRQEKIYTLNIENIFLDVYETGVALLSFHVSNNKYNTWDDIRYINEFGRHVYPPFLGTSDRILSTQKVHLPESIEVRFTGNEPILEDFKHYNSNLNLQIPAHIKTILGPAFFKCKKSNKTYFRVDPLLDDRMFVICWFIHDELSEKLKKSFSESPDTGIMEEWHKYVFIDADHPSCKNDDMLREQTKNHTYTRFSGYGTLYGVSRYSFVMLTREEGRMFTRHVETMYFKMVMLSLMQRATILRFSKEVTLVATRLKGIRHKAGSLVDSITDITSRYLKFTNKMYFREITAQEQGIELFDIVQDKMRIERDVKDLNREIDELYQYSNLIEDKKNNDLLSTLTILGAVFLIPTFITGLLGINLIDFNMFTPSQMGSNYFPKMWFLFTGIAVFPFLGILYYFSRKQNRQRKKLLLSILILIIVVFILLVIWELAKIKLCL